MFVEFIKYMETALEDDKKAVKRDLTLNLALYVGGSYNLIPAMMAIGINVNEHLKYSAQLSFIFGRKMESMAKDPSTLVMSDYEVHARVNTENVPVFGET